MPVPEQQRESVIPEPEEQIQLTDQEQIDLEYRELRDKITIPYLPPLEEAARLPKRAHNDPNQVYTLVLDLDETLIHFEVDQEMDPNSEEPGYYMIRPGALRFLSELSEYYEVVVFTAAMPDYADWILDNIDRAGKIQHRLYRQHTTPHEDYAIKDLKYLGRDLSRTIIIDNLAENFNYTTPLNGIWVESWYDDMDDNILGLLIPFLKQIVDHKINVTHLLTEHIKSNILYKMLDDHKILPSASILLQESIEFENEELEKQQI